MDWSSWWSTDKTRAASIPRAERLNTLRSSSENASKESQQACWPSHMAVPHSLACSTKSVMAYATLNSSVGKQEGWRAKISEHWDRNDRQELGSPEYGTGGLSQGSASQGTAPSGPRADVEARSAEGLTCSWSSRSPSRLSWSETSA